MLSEKKARSRSGKEIGFFALLGQAFWVGLVNFFFFPIRGTAGISHARETGIISI